MGQAAVEYFVAVKCVGGGVRGWCGGSGKGEQRTDRWTGAAVHPSTPFLFLFSFFLFSFLVLFCSWSGLVWPGLPGLVLCSASGDRGGQPDRAREKIVGYP